MSKLPKEETLRLRHSHIGRSCPLFFASDPLKLVRASTHWMYDEMDAAYLDCINNVCHVGHCNEHVVEEGIKQMRLINTNSRFLHDKRVTFAQNLLETLPKSLQVVYFVNSGSEANDLALRLAHTHTKSDEVITLEHAYHGHVISLINISPYKLDQPGCYEQKPHNTHVVAVPDIYRGKFRDTDYSVEELSNKYAAEVEDVCNELKAMNKKPSCFIAESLQSCGGQIIYPEGYLKAVYNKVRASGGVCIADEVQVGLGRIGHPYWWGFELQDVVPDIVTMGKPMGNGHPLAAVVTTREIAESFAKTGVSYFNTFGGNPVSCAIGQAVLDVIEAEHLRENAESVGKYLVKSLKQLQQRHQAIGDVRGVGLFVGVDLVLDRASREPDTNLARQIVQKMRDLRILVQSDGPFDNVIKLKPPLTFGMEEADIFLKAFQQCLNEAQHQEK